MAPPLRMVVVDRVGPSFGSPEALMRDLLEAINGFWRGAGCPGCAVRDVRFDIGDVVTVETIIGRAPLTIEDLRAAYKLKGKAA